MCVETVNFNVLIKGKGICIILPALRGLRLVDLLSHLSYMYEETFYSWYKNV